MAAVCPRQWEKYLDYPFHIGGRPGVIGAEIGFWGYLVAEGEAVAEGLANYAVDSFRGDAAQSLSRLIRSGYATEVGEVIGHADSVRRVLGDYDEALSELRELMELNKDQARLHRDGWEDKGREFDALENALMAAAAAGDRTRYHRVEGEMLVVQEEYLRHIREFSIRFDNAVGLHDSVVELDAATTAALGELAELIESATAPALPEEHYSGAELAVEEERLIEAGRRLIDEGLYLEWLPAAVLPLPAEGVDDIAGHRVAAASKSVVDALDAAVGQLSERIQVTGSAMVGAAVRFASADEDSAAALLEVIRQRDTSEAVAGSRRVAGESQAMVAELAAALGGRRPFDSRVLDGVDRGASGVTDAATVVTTAAAIAEAVDAGVPVGEAVRSQAAEPMAREATRELAFAKVNHQLGKRVAGTVATSLVKPRLVGRMGRIGVAANVVIAGYDGLRAAREVRETKRRMEIRARQVD